MERQRRDAAFRVRDLLSQHPQRISPLAALKLGIDILGPDNALIHDASRYMSFFARSQGYDIPAYDLAGCGEIKLFFQDYGVRNMPQWYALIGVAENTYTHLHEYDLLVLKDPSHRRWALPVQSLWWGRIEGNAEEEAQALLLLSRIFDFVLDARAPDSAVLY